MPAGTRPHLYGQVKEAEHQRQHFGNVLRLHAVPLAPRAQQPLADRAGCQLQDHVQGAKHARCVRGWTPAPSAGDSLRWGRTHQEAHRSAHTQRSAAVPRTDRGDRHRQLAAVEGLDVQGLHPGPIHVRHWAHLRPTGGVRSEGAGRRCLQSLRRDRGVRLRLGCTRSSKRIGVSVMHPGDAPGRSRGCACAVARAQRAPRTPVACAKPNGWDACSHAP